MENRIMEIKERIVNNEVLACVTDLVEYILSTSVECGVTQSPFSYDDIENLMIDNDDEIEKLESDKETMENRLEEIKELIESDFENIREFYDLQDERDYLESQIDILDSEIYDLESENGEYKEAYEYWITTNWLGDKLADRGEIVIRDGFRTIWGRQTSGQSISMDWVIEDIATEMANRD